MAQYEDSQYEEAAVYAAASNDRRSRSPSRQRSRSRDRRDRSKDRSSRRDEDKSRSSRRHSPESRRRSRSRSYEERRSSRREGRSRSRSPRRSHHDEVSHSAPTGPRALQSKGGGGQYYPPSSVHHPNHTPQTFPQRPSSPLNIQLAEYQVVLPSPGLIRFLIGPGGHRSRAVKAFSNVIRLTFAEENQIDGQVGTGVGLGKLRGSEDSIKRALECIRGLIEEEVTKEQADGGRPKFDYGEWNEWAQYDTSKIVWLGKSKEEYFEMKKGLGQQDGKGFNRGAFEASGGAGGEWSTPGVVGHGQNQRRSNYSPREERRSSGNDYRSDAGYLARPPAGQPTIVRNPNSSNPVGSIHLNSWSSGAGPVSAMASVPHHAPGNQPHQQPFYISQQSYEEKDRREKEKGPYGHPDVVIPVPPVAVAALIGPKGAMIRDINSRSGAYCRIDRSGPLPMLNIFGTGEVIEKVMELIDEIILKWDTTWTGGMNQPNQLALGQEREEEQSSRRDNGSQEQEFQQDAQMDSVKMEDSNYESGREREYTEEEVMAILDSLPAGMFSKIISKRFEAPPAR